MAIMKIENGNRTYVIQNHAWDFFTVYPDAIIIQGFVPKSEEDARAFRDMVMKGLQQFYNRSGNTELMK